MNRRPKIGKDAFLLGCLFLLAGTCFFQARAISRAHVTTSFLTERESQLTEKLRQIRNDAVANRADLEELRNQIQISTREDLTGADRQLADDMRAWSEKLATVKKLFADHPEYKIPEIDRLPLRAYLGAIKEGQFDSEEHTRMSLAKLRGAAKDLFASELAFAVRKYLRDHDEAFPSTTSELSPYLDHPSDAAILGRYKMMQSGKLSGARSSSSKPVLLEIAPIDDEYDGRTGLSAGQMPDGHWAAMRGTFGGFDGPAAWIDGYQDSYRQARAAYIKEHGDAKGAGIAEFAPYFSSPLPPATLQKLMAHEQAQAKAKKSP